MFFFSFWKKKQKHKRSMRVLFYFFIIVFLCFEKHFFFFGLGDGTGRGVERGNRIPCFIFIIVCFVFWKLFCFGMSRGWGVNRVPCFFFIIVLFMFWKVILFRGRVNRMPCFFIIVFLRFEDFFMFFLWGRRKGWGKPKIFVAKVLEWDKKNQTEREREQKKCVLKKNGLLLCGCG